MPSSHTARLYASLPTPLQHAATAAYGFKERRLRRGGVYPATRRLLERSQWLSEAEILDLQRRRLQALVAHALATTSFWPERLTRARVDADRIHSLEDLRRLPLLDKRTLVENADALCSRGVTAVRHYFTSGTTGTTLAIPIDAASRQRNYAFFARALSWAGVEHGRSATFAGRPVVPSDVAEPRCLWRWNPAMRNRLFSSYHLAPQNARGYAKALCQWAPEYIDSYPSAIASLAHEIRAQGLEAPRPRAVVTSSETLLAPQRQLIEEVFGARCFDQYGCTEQAAYVSQCEQGTYHVHPEYGIVEVLTPGGEPAKPDESGELVCTSFTNDALPLLRYRTGDVGVLSASGCECGRAFPVLHTILGRVDDLIVTPDGREIGRLDPVFKGRRTIREAQIVQESATDVIVRIVPGPGYQPSDGESVATELRARLGSEMHVAIRTTDAIERTRAGKFRAVVNRTRRPASSIDDAQNG